MADPKLLAIAAKYDGTVFRRRETTMAVNVPARTLPRRNVEKTAPAEVRAGNARQTTTGSLNRSINRSLSHGGNTRGVG